VADWHPYAVEDGLLITGQNPASSKLVAEKLLVKLNSKK
jgi:putative intracellular protease/amidase